MWVSLLSDMLDELWQLAQSLLQTHSVTVHQVMSFLGEAIFVPMVTQLWLFCCVIKSDILNVYHYLACLFSSLYFSPLDRCQLQRLSQLQLSPVSLQFPLPEVLIAMDATLTNWTFLFSGFQATFAHEWLMVRLCAQDSYCPA